MTEKHTPQAGDLYRVKKSGNVRRVTGINPSWADTSVSWERVGPGSGPTLGRCARTTFTRIAEHIGHDDEDATH